MIPALSGGAHGAVSVAAGYDIILIGGQSNQFFGATKSGLDTTDARVYQFYYGGAGTANTVSPSGAQDPLDHPDTSGVAAPTIGHTVRFAVDSYIGGGKLLAPRKVLLVPNAYGGTRVLNTALNGWGANTGKGGGTTIGSLLTDLVTRANLAKALTGTNTIKMLDWHKPEGDFAGYSTFQTGQINKYRWALISALRYLRAQIGGNFPIVMGRATNWSINVGDGVNYIPANMREGDKIERAISRRLPYVSFVDTVNPTLLSDASSVHMDAAGQRGYAAREGAAYPVAVANANYQTSPTWDDIDYVTSAAGYLSGYTITNSALDLSGDANAGWKSAIATMPNSTGLVYWEVQAAAVASATNLGYLGVCNQDFTFENYLGLSSSNAGHDEAAAGIWGLSGQASSVCGTGTSPWVLRAPLTLAADIAVNGRFMFALNRTAGKLWAGVNGTWLGSGNPVAGTNEWINGIPATDLVFIAASIYAGAANTWRIQAKASEQTYSAPTGFTAWGA